MAPTAQVQHTHGYQLLTSQLLILSKSRIRVARVSSLWREQSSSHRLSVQETGGRRTPESLLRYSLHESTLSQQPTSQSGSVRICKPAAEPRQVRRATSLVGMKQSTHPAEEPQHSAKSGASVAGIVRAALLFVAWAGVVPFVILFMSLALFSWR